MSIIGIDHIQLAMPAGQEDKARAFYSHLLGIPEIPKPTAHVKRGGAWFENDLVKIHLGVEAKFNPARKAHPGLLVSELRKLTEKLRDAGFDVSEDEPLIALAPRNTRFRLVANLCRAGLFPAGFHQKFSATLSFT